MTANAQTKIIGYFFVLFKYKYLSISKYYLFETNKTAHHSTSVPQMFHDLKFTELKKQLHIYKCILTILMLLHFCDQLLG